MSVLARPDEARDTDLDTRPDLLLELSTDRGSRSLTGLHPTAEQAPWIPGAEGVFGEQKTPVGIANDGEDAHSVMGRTETHGDTEQPSERTEYAKGQGERSLHPSRLAATPAARPSGR